jgi:hypothetical protein
LLDPTDVLGRDARALRRFVQAGGHLVAGGAERNAWLSEIVSPGPVWLRGSDTTTTLKPLAPVPEVAGVNEARTAGKGLWSDSRGTLPALGARDPVVTVASVGRGRVVLLADASPLQNGLLAQADNAALGIALAGPAGRRVVFAETVHGYGEARGLAALPERWKWLLVGLLVAGIVWVASRIRRLGPAEDESRPLPPPRRAYVDAVAAALARTRKPSASAERVRTAARRRVARRAGLGSDPPDDRIAAAAATLGFSDEEAAALTRPARDEDEDLLLAGRALARTNGRKR